MRFPFAQPFESGSPPVDTPPAPICEFCGVYDVAHCVIHLIRHPGILGGAETLFVPALSNRIRHDAFYAFAQQSFCLYIPHQKCGWQRKHEFCDSMIAKRKPDFS